MARVAPLLMNETKNEEQGQREPGEIIDDEEEEDVAAAAIKPIPVEPHQELAMPAHPVEIRFAVSLVMFCPLEFQFVP